MADIEHAVCIDVMMRHPVSCTAHTSNQMPHHNVNANYKSQGCMW